MKKLISVLIPCYNESESLPLLMPKLEDIANEYSQYNWEYLCVNDGSKDNTLEVLRELRREYARLNYIDLSRNYGKETAMLAGFDYVKGDCMVIMDADLQHPPHVIPQMLEKWQEGYDDIYASRITRGKESWLRKKFSLLYYNILQRTTRLEVLPNVGDFRLLDRSCIEALKKMRENNRYTKGMFCYIGYKKTHVAFETEDRIAGESSMNYKTLFNLAIEGILSYTTVPLRIATIVGCVTSLLAFVYMLVIFIRTILFGDLVQGYPTMIIVILSLGGIQLLALGILGEYLGRVFTETKNRPVYFVRTYNDEKI